MSVISKMSGLHQKFEGRQEVLRTALAIARMEPTARRSLATYLKALNTAQECGDEDEQKYVIDAIMELFNQEEDGGSLEEWRAEMAGTSEGERAAAHHRRNEEKFFESYWQHKQSTGFTVRELASKAGLSPTTIVAIEKQRVKPQEHTLRAIAKAFGVSVDEMCGAVQSSQRRKK